MIAPPIAAPRARILAAATRLFARYGYEGVSLQRIADEVGLHKSSLFHHYRNKVELVAEVIEAAVVPVVDIVRPLADREPPRVDDFLEVMDQLVDHFSQHPDSARLILSAMSAAPESELHEPSPHTESTYVELLTIVWGWLDRAKRAGAIRDVNVRQTILNLIGVVLFYPAVAPTEMDIAGPTPFSPKARQHRKRELRILARGILEPR